MSKLTSAQEAQVKLIETNISKYSLIELRYHPKDEKYFYYITLGNKDEKTFLENMQKLKTDCEFKIGFLLFADNTTRTINMIRKIFINFDKDSQKLQELDQYTENKYSPYKFSVAEKELSAKDKIVIACKAYTVFSNFITNHNMLSLINVYEWYRTEYATLADTTKYDIYFDAKLWKYLKNSTTTAEKEYAKYLEQEQTLHPTDHIDDILMTDEDEDKFFDCCSTMDAIRDNYGIEKTAHLKNDLIEEDDSQSCSSAASDLPPKDQPTVSTTEKTAAKTPEAHSISEAYVPSTEQQAQVAQPTATGAIIRLGLWHRFIGWLASLFGISAGKKHAFNVRDNQQSQDQQMS